MTIFKSLKFFTIYFFVCTFFLVRAEINPDWEKPDAFSRHRKEILEKDSGAKNTEVIPVKSPITCDEGQHELGTIFYKRLARLLFKEEKFKEAEPDFVTRTIRIKLKKDSLHTINSFINEDGIEPLKDLDIEIIKVIEESEGGFLEFVKEETFTLYEKFLRVLRDKNVQAVLQSVFIIIVVPLLVWCFGWRIAIAVFLIIFCFDFATFYINCNKRKEVDQLIKFLQNKDPSKTPCDGIDLSEKSWSVFFGKFFGTGEQNNCMAFMREKSKVELESCPLRDVFIGYFFDWYTNILKRFYISALDAFGETTENFSFFGKISASTTFLPMLFLVIFGIGYFLTTLIVPLMFHGLQNRIRSRRQSSDSSTAAIKNDNLTALLTLTLTNQLLKQNKKISKAAVEGRPKKATRKRSTAVNRVEELPDDEADALPDSEECEEFETLEVPNQEQNTLESLPESKDDPPIDEKENITSETTKA